MAGSGVRTYRWQRRKERAVKGDARREFPGRTGSTERDSPLSSFLSTDHHVRLLVSRTVIVQSKWSAFSCFLPGRSENLFLDCPAFSRFLSITKMPGDVCCGTPKWPDISMLPWKCLPIIMFAPLPVVQPVIYVSQVVCLLMLSTRSL
jgi:hypothetical protein